MSELLEQHCVLLEQWISNYALQNDREDIRNDLHQELTRLQSTNVVVFREQMSKVTSLLSYKVLQLNGSIMEFLLDYFLRLLKQWYQSAHFTDDYDAKTFENLADIFFKDYSVELANESAIEEFIRCLDAIGNTGEKLFTNKYITVINDMLNVHINRESDYGSNFMNETVFDDVVVRCLCSAYVPHVFNQLKSSARLEERTLAENFVFNGLFRHIDRICREKLEENSSTLREHLLPSVSDLLDAFEQDWKDWSESAINILASVTIHFLYSVQMTLMNDIHLSIQKHICDTAIRILSLPNYRSMRLNQNCLQYVYMGTLHDKIIDYLKGQNLTSTMFRIAGFYKDEKEIQFNTYRILAAIMTEEDIKRLDDPGAIAKIFLDHLAEIKHWLGWETRLRNLLTTLKILLQHDQIRDEIYKLNGVTLFIFCATTARFDALIHQRALENLLIMSFSDTVCQDLKENETFMEYLKSTSDNSTESDLQRAANSLLWRLTKDETSKSPIGEQSAKTAYDIMISYSHKDKDLCFQLYDRLTKDKYRVWLDRDQMHGTPLESMSNAIESSEFVFVCMSDSYKQSGYCKMEAYYALERQCCIIPLVMKSQYKADGWLGIIVTGRMRVDFPKYGFEVAYRNLITEINRNRKEKKTAAKITDHETPTKINDHETPKDDKPVKEKKVTYQSDKDHILPKDIQQWTNDDVQQFLLKQHLENFLPICTRMNGTRLAGLHRMCTSNSPVMFQSLNMQLTTMKTDEKTDPIEIVEFLQFVEDLQPFVPVVVEKKEVSSSQSSVCTIL